MPFHSVHQSVVVVCPCSAKNTCFMVMAGSRNLIFGKTCFLLGRCFSCNLPKHLPNKKQLHLSNVRFIFLKTSITQHHNTQKPWRPKTIPQETNQYLHHLVTNKIKLWLYPALFFAIQPLPTSETSLHVPFTENQPRTYATSISTCTTTICLSSTKQTRETKQRLMVID